MAYLIERSSQVSLMTKEESEKLSLTYQIYSAIRELGNQESLAMLPDVENDLNIMMAFTEVHNFNFTQMGTFLVLFNEAIGRLMREIDLLQGVETLHGLAIVSTYQKAQDDGTSISQLHGSSIDIEAVTAPQTFIENMKLIVSGKITPNGVSRRLEHGLKERNVRGALVFNSKLRTGDTVIPQMLKTFTRLPAALVNGKTELLAKKAAELIIAQTTSET